MRERDYYLGFSLISGIGPKTFLKLIKNFGFAEKAWFASSIELSKAGLSKRLITLLIKTREDFNFLKYQQILKQKKVSFVAICDYNYPILLKEIDNPPIVLFVKGNINILNDNHCIGIVGTRKITSYGREVTSLFASDLATSDFAVVSGLAMGVDAVAAWSALNSRGKTVAVLGNGVDLCFPSSNEKLYDKILENSGCILSEFPLGQTPTPGSFPSRNRIIAGLSLGVLVTEGAQDSGSLITAEYAFKYDRKVFAVPGPITSSLSVAPLKLIEKGAKLVTSAKDIMKELRIKNLSSKLLVNETISENLSKDEQKIVKLLENENLSFDEIVRKSNINASNLATLLSMMEIKGLIKDISGEYVFIN